MITQLAIYGSPDMEKIKQAKKLVADDFSVQPVQATFKTSQRILAWDSVPSFLCDYALVGEKTSQAGLCAAVRWALELSEDSRAMTIEKSLQSILGPLVREIKGSELMQEKIKAKHFSTLLKLDE